LVFEKIAIFFAENWRKSQKIVFITSTPGLREQQKNRIRFFASVQKESFRQFLLKMDPFVAIRVDLGQIFRTFFPGKIPRKILPQKCWGKN
jgi:hypothetical protein